MDQEEMKRLYPQLADKDIRPNPQGILIAKPQQKAVAKRETKYGKRHVAGVMNQTETAYADLLEMRKQQGLILCWWFERITIKLGDDCRFTPDFLVVREDMLLECVDVKGSGPIDPKSKVKVKCAAQEFWPFLFVVEQKQTKANGGGWKRTEF